MKNELDLSACAYGDVIGKEFSLVILPWGATEPHNYHLPYLTDSILSYELALEAADEALASGVRAMVLPSVNLGSQNPGQRELPFCIHARYETQYYILRDIVASLHYQGMRKLLIVNGHGGNSFKNMIRDLAVDYPDFLIAVCEWFRLTDNSSILEIKGEHADELETSVMLHYHPELVDMDKAGSGATKSSALKTLNEGLIWIPRNWKDISSDSGVGDPRKSTAEKGKLIAEKVVAKLTEIIVDLGKAN